MTSGRTATATARRASQLECTPLHQLQSLGDGHWLALGDDPHFLVQLPGRTTQPGIHRISVSLEGEHLERPCIYLDTGDGWNEAGRLELAADGPGRWTALVAVAGLTGFARFDPSERAGRFRLGPMEIEHQDPHALLLELLAAEARAHPARAAAILAHGAALASDEGPLAACRWLLAGGAAAPCDPPESYAAWIREHDTLSEADADALRAAVQRMPARPVLVLLLPLSASVRSDQLQACIASLLSQCYPDWRLVLVGDAVSAPQSVRDAAGAAVAASTRITWLDAGAFDVAAWNRAIDASRGDYIGVIEGAPVLAPHALMALARAVVAHPGTGLVYSDCDRLGADGRRLEPDLRPAWNPDLFLARDYIGGAALLEAGLVRKAGGFRDAHAPAAFADLALRCVDSASAPPVHVPLLLSHWHAGEDEAGQARAEARCEAVREHLGGRAAVACTPGGARVRWPLPERVPRVSIVVPTRDRAGLLEQCVESIVSRSSYPDYELLVVDNGSVEADALDYLVALESRPRVRVLRYAQPFNYSAINNFAVAQAQGEVIALVNNDIEVISADWLEEMVAHALRPGVGAVGAMLYYPDDTIQHAGVVIGLGGVAGHVYSRQPRGSSGQGGRAAVAQEMSAVTAACLVVRRSAWDEVGGLDERLAVAFNDVDFCLRLRRAGYRNVWTPHAELYHHESASRGQDDQGEKLRRFHAEVAFMVERWGTVLDDDPAYSPNLSLRHGAANQLAWPPRRGLHHWLAGVDAAAGLAPAAARTRTRT